MKIHEIFYSIQGESTCAGLPCAFVRLTGCNLRCAYCDTAHAYEDGDERTLEQVLDAVTRYPVKRVEITGGEPLLQAETTALISAFADEGYTVLLETNGTVSIRDVDARAVAIVDVKCPGSGMSGQVLWDNIALLKPHDEVKFVLMDRTDYDWAVEVIDKHGLLEKHVVNLSPAYAVLEPRQLAGWILDDGLDVRLQLQLHKYIWPGVERGV